MGLIQKLESVLNQDFERISYTEAIDILLRSADYKKKKFKFEVSWGIDLQSEHERYLVEKHFGNPVIVTDGRTGSPACWAWFAKSFSATALPTRSAMTSTIRRTITENMAMTGPRARCRRFRYRTGYPAAGPGAGDCCGSGRVGSVLTILETSEPPGWFMRSRD